MGAIGGRSTIYNWLDEFGKSESNDERQPGPPRVLYSACAPRDAVELGCEKGEYPLLQTLTQPDQDVADFGCDLGAFDELQNRVREGRRRMGGRNKAPRTLRPDGRPTPQNP